MKINPTYKNLVFVFIVITGIVIFYSSCKKPNPDYPGGPCPACPHLISIMPNTVKKGDTIQIKGTNFNLDISLDSILMNGKAVEICNSCPNSTTVLYAIVPAKIGSGYLKVYVDGDLESQDLDSIAFTYKFTYTLNLVGGGPLNNNLKAPAGLTVDENNDVYVADMDSNLILKITNNAFSIFAGDGSIGFDNGDLDTCQFSYPTDIKIKLGGFKRFYVTDINNYSIREINPDNTNISSIAGIANTPGNNDGYGASARFRSIQGLAVYNDTILIVSQTPSFGGWSSIRKVNLSSHEVKSITTATSNGFQDGPLATAKISFPYGLDVASNGDIYFTDNNRIRKIRKTNNGWDEIFTIAGNGSPGFSDSIGSYAMFNNPTDVKIDSESKFLYVADNGNHCIRKIDLLSLEVETIVGHPQIIGWENGYLNYPYSLCFDNDQNLIFTEQGNHCVRKIILE